MLSRSGGRNIESNFVKNSKKSHRQITYGLTYINTLLKKFSDLT
jgi:hypothetical protein